MLVSVPWALGCLPSQELSSYSEGSASGAGGEQPAPSESEPGDPPPGDDSNEGLPSGDSIPTPFTPDESAADGGGGATATASSDTGGVDAGTAVDAGAPVASPCAPGEVLGAEGNCHFLQTTLLSWEAARASCQARGPGWDLAVVRSLDESVFLADLLTAEAWVGASDIDSEGSWIWVTDAAPFWMGGAAGSAVDGAYTNWNATEPNGGIMTNCARALPNSFGSATPNAPWADLPCAQLRAAVCEAHGAPG